MFITNIEYIYERAFLGPSERMSYLQVYDCSEKIVVASDIIIQHERIRAFWGYSSIKYL